MDEWEGRLRIGLFTNVYLPTTNGVVVSIEAFRKALTRLGHHAYVFGPDSGDIEDRAPYIFRYPAVELPLQKYPLTFPISPYIDHLFKNLRPQVLHANHPALLGRVAIRKSREHNLPLVYTYHTRYADYAHYAEPLPQPKIKEFITLWLRDFMTECHHVVVPSQSIKDMLLEQYPTIRNVSIVPTGVDTRRFSGFEKSAVRKELGWTDEKVVISVGRLAREKSFHVLIKAFARLDLADTRLVIIGEGDERENLEELIQESGCADRVTLTGLVPFHQVPKYLAAADLFSFASITETQGLVTMEAMAAGLPVVAVEASGTREAVDSSCAVLTQYEPEALARGLQEMLSRDNLAKASEASRQRALEFDIMKQGEAMVEVYEQARESHRAGQYVLSERKELRDRLEEIFEILKP